MTRVVVLLGGADGLSQIKDTIREAGAIPVAFADWPAAKKDLSRDKILAVVFQARMPQFEQMCVDLRSESDHEDLPLVAITESLWDSRLGRLFMFSIDDFVAETHIDALGPKLTSLSEGDPYEGLPPAAGRVVVADPDRSRRILHGRLLRKKGLQVDFAINAAEVAKAAASDDKAHLVLTHADLPPKGARAAWVEYQAQGGRLASIPWLVAGSETQRATVVEPQEKENLFRSFSTNEPPENLLFLINELLSPPPANVRASERLLFGAPATFALQGSGGKVGAFTYNINRTGVFLRTLVPPPIGASVVVEIRPPYGEGRAVVEGKVVWRKEPSSSSGPVVPSGMGLVYTRVPIADGAALEAGYDALVKASPDVHEKS